MTDPYILCLNAAHQKGDMEAVCITDHLDKDFPKITGFCRQG